MSLSRFRFAGPLALAITALTALAAIGAAPANAADVPTIPATVHRTIIDETAGSDEVITLDFGGLTATVDEPALEDLESGTRVKVAVEGATTGAEAVERLTEDPTAITAVQIVSKPGPQVGTHGAVVHNVTVVPVTWEGATPFKRTPENLEAMIRKSLDVWATLGRGKITPGTVTMLDTVVIPDPGTGCNISTYGNPAKQALGRGPSSATDHWIYVPSQSKGCGWSGLAYVPGNEIALANDLPWGTAPDYSDGTAWQTVGHELGHNFGLSHALGQACTATCSSPTQDLQILGSAADANRVAAPTNAYHSALLGAFTDANTPLITEPGTYQLTSINETSGVQALRLHPTTGTDIYLEYRPDEPSGWTRPGWLGGLMANRAYPSSTRNSELLDLTPGHAYNKYATQPALMTGNTWQVPDTGYTVRLISADGPTATVEVTETAADTSAPAAPTNVTASESETGWITTPTLPVSWTPAATAAADAVVGYRVTARDTSGRQWVASTPADQTSVTMTMPTAEGWWPGGQMTINVQALDAAGNASTEATVASGYDATKPGKATIRQPAPYGTVTSATFDLVWDTPTETGSGLSRYELVIDNTVVKTVPAGVNTATLPTPYKTYFYVWVRPIDIAGNQGDKYAVWYYSRLTAPQAPILSRPTTGETIHDNEVSLAWTQTNPTDVASYRLTVDGTEVTPAPAATDREWTLTLPDGDHTITLTAVNARASASASVSTTVDAIPRAPTAPVITSPGYEETLHSNEVHLTWTQPDPGLVDSYELVVNGSLVNPAPAATDREWTLTLPDGIHDLSLRAQNPQGEAWTFHFFFIDTQP